MIIFIGGKGMEKVKMIARREAVEQQLKEAEKELKDIQSKCNHEVIIMYKCANYYWVDAKCLFCGKKMDEFHVIKNKKNIVNTNLQCLLSERGKYIIVKEKYLRIVQDEPNLTNEQVVEKINNELIKAQASLEELRKNNK